jgi:tRNA(Ile)-lysidine synthase
MNDFEERVIAYAAEHRLLPSGGTVLVALSGGGDSVALLHILARTAEATGITIEAAHLNHSLRGAESDEDEEFCRGLCGRLGISLTVERLGEHALDRGTGVSFETAAREARRTFLDRTARDMGACRIATGHTGDDQAETVLQRLMRGTGPSGLAGILPVNDGLWVRPLLGCSRGEVREYLAHLGADFREDSTNRDTSILRNGIRHELIPFIESRFAPGIRGALAGLAELSRVQEEYLDMCVEELLRACRVYEDSRKILLDGAVFASYHTALRSRAIRACLEKLEGRGRDTDRGEVERILGVLESGNGEMDVTPRVRCGAGKGIAAFALHDEWSDPVPVAVPGVTSVPAGGRITARGMRPDDAIDGRSTVLVDRGVMERYGGLSVGKVKRGECMVPFGGKGPVRISGLLSDSPVPGVLRDSIPVVRAGGVVVWVPGVRSAECLRIERAGAGTMVLRYDGGPEWRYPARAEGC